MIYKITITEIHKTVVDIEANSRDEALKRIEEEYWKNPNNYVLEPRDTYFEQKACLSAGIFYYTGITAIEFINISLILVKVLAPDHKLTLPLASIDRLEMV